MMATLYILSSVLLASAAQLLIKGGVLDAGRNFSTPPNRMELLRRCLRTPFIVLGLALYAVATILWLLALALVDLSYAFPFVSLSLFLTVAGANVFFGEALCIHRFVGIGLISIGIFVIAIS